MKTTIDNLGTMAAEVAMRAAVSFLKARDLADFGSDDSDSQALDRLLALIRTHAKAAVGTALDDAGAAIAAGMAAAAEQTFRATMAMAGIKAAKEFLGVQNG